MEEGDKEKEKEGGEEEKKENGKGTPSVMLTDSYLYFYPYKCFSYYQAYRYKISSSAPTLEFWGGRGVRLGFKGGKGEEEKGGEKEGEGGEKGGWEKGEGRGKGGEKVGERGGKGGMIEEPRFVLEKFEWGGEGGEEKEGKKGIELEFRSIDERDSFKNMLALACGMSRMAEESGVVVREREEREEEKERLMGRIGRQVAVLEGVRDRKDEVINDFKRLSKEHKAWKGALMKKQQRAQSVI